MPLASATFRLAGDEEFELQIKPGTGTGSLHSMTMSMGIRHTLDRPQNFQNR